MRALLIGLSAAIAFAFLNGVIVYSSSGENSLFYFGIFGVIPVDWMLIGAWMGIAVGLTHRGIHAADNVSVFVSGGAASLFCALLSHALQFGSFVGGWDLNLFIQYLGIFGESWKIGPWYMWLSLPLTVLTGGAVAVGLSASQRADNIRAQLPPWVSPTTRILIRVARADGKVDSNEASMIAGMIRAQMIKSLPGIPNDLDTALSDVIRAEADSIREGVSLEHDLNEKCFRSSYEQCESTAMLAIAVAQCDGAVDEAEAKILNKLVEAWAIDGLRSRELVNRAFDEFAHPSYSRPHSRPRVGSHDSQLAPQANEGIPWGITSAHSRGCRSRYMTTTFL